MGVKLERLKKYKYLGITVKTSLNGEYGREQNDGYKQNSWYGKVCQLQGLEVNMLLVERDGKVS